MAISQDTLLTAALSFLRTDCNKNTHVNKMVASHDLTMNKQLFKCLTSLIAIESFFGRPNLGNISL